MARASTPRRRPRAAPPVGTPKGAAIVAAAQRLFLRYGFRRTSMDLLAAEAQVAKPTLYAYFADKDAVFRAVVEAVMSTITDRARAAAAKPGPVGDRLAGVLVAKFTFLHELLHDSPHAAELLDSQGRVGADVVAHHDDEVRRILAGVIDDGIAARELDLHRAAIAPAGLVDALLRLGHGAAYGGPTVAAHRRQLQELVRLLLVGIARVR